MKIIVLLLLFYLIASIICSVFYKNKNDLGFMSKYTTDSLKGIAIFMILINHIGQSYNISMVNPLGPIGVCLFLILSGYGLNESYKKNGLASFFQKKIIRVLIPYWKVIICFSVYLLIINNFKIIDFFKSIILIKLTNPIHWYILFIIIWYVFYYVVSRYVKNQNTEVIIFFFISIVFTFLNLNNFKYVWQIFSFPLGVLISNKEDSLKLFLSFKKSIITAIVMFFITLIAVTLKLSPYVNSHQFGAVDNLMQIIISLSFSLMVIVISNIIKTPKIFYFSYVLGMLSYEIYLIHPYFLTLLRGKKLIIEVAFFLIFTTILSFTLQKLKIENLFKEKKKALNSQ